MNQNNAAKSLKAGKVTVVLRKTGQETMTERKELRKYFKSFNSTKHQPETYSC